MFRRVVKFRDGKYGIRRWTLFDGYQYLDLQYNRQVWWKPHSNHFEDCKSSFNTVMSIVDKGKPLSKKEIDQYRLLNILKEE